MATKPKTEPAPAGETAAEQVERLRVVEDTTPAPHVVMNAEVAKKLREPFRPEQIGKLPRVTCPDCRKSDTKVCNRHEKRRCRECGGWLTDQHIHLDYVGHAAATDRLLAVDPYWTWEPFAITEYGLPAFDAKDGLWIHLTIAGVTRPGYGDVTNSGGVKEVIGDAIRNAAMRFGVALDLWSKEDLATAPDGEPGGSETPSEPSQAGGKGETQGTGDAAGSGAQAQPAGERAVTAAQAKKVRAAADEAGLEPLRMNEVIAVVTSGSALTVEAMVQKQLAGVVQAFKDYAKDPPKGESVVESWREAHADLAEQLDAGESARLEAEGAGDE